MLVSDIENNFFAALSPRPPENDASILSSLSNTGNIEDEYEDLTFPDFTKEDLSVLMKVSDFNNIIDSNKKNKLRSEKELILKKLEGKIGKKAAAQQMKKLEKRLKQAAEKEKEIFEKVQQKKKIKKLFSIDSPKDNFWSDQNFYNEHEVSINLPKNENDEHNPAKILKKKLLEKFGLKEENLKKETISEYNNTLYLIKKRIDFHMNYLKKKNILKKIKEFVIETLYEKEIIRENVDRKKAKEEIKQIKYEIYAIINGNNMLSDGIRYLFKKKKDIDAETETKINLVIEKVKVNLCRLMGVLLLEIKERDESGTEIFDYEIIRLILKRKKAFSVSQTAICKI